MAGVRVTGATFVDKRLPPVCVKTGRPASMWRQVTAVHTPPWIVVLLLFGVLPYFIAYACSQQKLRGWVPVSAGVLARRRAGFGAIFAAGVGAAVTVMVIQIIGRPLTVLLLAWLAAAVMAGVWIAVESGVEARLNPSDRSVTLRWTHPRFAKAASGIPPVEGEPRPRARAKRR
jgi:hypothetical protein